MMLAGSVSAPVLTALPAAAADPAGNLPSAGSGPRPGPGALYAPSPRAPQLENTGVWKAEPILVSGAQGYRGGEWLYQDFLYDDHGARGVPDPASADLTGDYLFSPFAGTYTYPTDEVLANNAADLVELRIRPQTDATLFRVTLNTLQDPERTAFTLALGEGAASVPWPHGAGVSSPAEVFLTVHGSTAEVTDALGVPLGPTPSASIDLERRQIQVSLPHSAFDPGTDTVRTTIGVGLWDVAGDSYLAPAASADDSTPGGAAPGSPAIVNVGPRFDEPQPAIKGKGYTIGDTAVLARAEASWWRELGQAQALATGDVSDFSADVDFGALAVGTTDDSQVPTTGSFDRILASAYSFGQGVDNSEVCTDVAGGVDSTPQCKGRYVGQLQPYNIYVPEKPAPAAGYGMTLLLHSLSANYNQYAASVYQRQIGERDAGSIAITPNGRGPDGFYMGYAETDTFEVWADVARHYPLDPTWVATTGYSMGGFGTYRMLARYPDLFGRGFSVVGIPGTVRDQLASLRNTPLLAWNSTLDELVPLNQAEDAETGLVEAGVPHTYNQFTSADHLTLASNDEFAPGADFLGGVRADRSPPRISYVVDPREDNAEAEVVADHAYWLSGLSVRDADAGTGTVEVLSQAFGQGVPQPLPVEPGGGALTGGFFPAMPFVQRSLMLGEPPTVPTADRLDVKASNVSRIVVDPVRARLTCAADVQIDSDGPVEVVLTGCPARAAGAPAPTAVPSSAIAARSGAIAAPVNTLPRTGTSPVLPALAAMIVVTAAAFRHRRTR